jgi:hypothetical membrane protein
VLRQILLACGIVSSLLYVATDVLGAVRYAGYSIVSQAVSELMAIGAPSKSFVDPLLIVYGLLVIAFGIGVMWDAAGRNGALRAVGALLIGYAVAGLPGPTFFAMHPRGASATASDLPHIMLTGVLVLLMLLANNVGAVTLDRRFYRYSLSPLLGFIAFGAVTGVYGARLAAQQPTPGMGIAERITIYSFLLWVAVLATALLRRPRFRDDAIASPTV